MKRRKEEDMLRIPGEEFTMQQMSVMMMKAQLMDITGACGCDFETLTYLLTYNFL